MRIAQNLKCKTNGINPFNLSPLRRPALEAGLLTLQSGSMMADGPFYFVVLSRNDNFNVQKLADVLNKVLFMPRIDALFHLKRYWGILYRTQELEKAQEIQQKLKQEGIETFLLKDSQAREIPSAKLLKKAVPGPEGLSFEEKEEKKILPWDNFLIICAGQVEKSIMVKKGSFVDTDAAKKITFFAISLATGIPISAKKTKPKEEIKKETGFDYCLDIIAKENSESVSISGYSFDYSYLGERNGYNTFLNFKNLVLDIAKFLPHAIRNQGALILETNGIMKDFKYNNSDDYMHEKLWLLQLSNIKRS